MVVGVVMLSLSYVILNIVIVIIVVLLIIIVVTTAQVCLIH
jgi:hypothetical protein